MEFLIRTLLFRFTTWIRPRPPFGPALMDDTFLFRFQDIYGQRRLEMQVCSLAVTCARVFQPRIPRQIYFVLETSPTRALNPV